MSLWAALIPAAVSLFTGNKAAKATKNAAAQAAQSSQDATDKAIAFYQKMVDQGRSDFAPYLEAGKKALTQYQGLITGMGNGSSSPLYSMDSLTQNPLYKSRYNVGMEQSRKSLAARGLTNSSFAIGEEINLADKIASDETSRQISMMENLMNMGTGAAGSTSSASQGLGQTASGLYQGTGNAIGDAAMVKGGATAGMWSNLNDLFQNRRALAGLPPQ